LLFSQIQAVFMVNFALQFWWTKMVAQERAVAFLRRQAAKRVTGFFRSKLVLA
jgi:hypothetical protein